MEKEKMFEEASRNKIRFNYKGSLTTEDLWDLTVEELDAIFKSLNAKVKESKEESLLNKRTKKDEEVLLKVDIVRHIVEVKFKEAAEAEEAVANKAKKQKILEILAAKKDQDLYNKSIEELEAMLK